MKAGAKAVQEIPLTYVKHVHDGPAAALRHAFQEANAGINAVGTAALVLVVVAAFVAWRRGRTPTPIDQRTVSVESAAQEMVLAHIGSSPS